MARMKNFKKCTLKEQVKRWQQAIKVLQRLTPHERRNHWNMTIFGLENECGTTACGAGFCAMDPWFQRRGFVGYFNRRGELVGPAGRPLGDATAKFFGQNGSDEIFFDGHQRGVTEVIKEMKVHIKNLEAGKETHFGSPIW